jgi:hypothetical protein
MPTPPKVDSLMYHIEKRVKNIAGCEQLDQMYPGGIEGGISDYLLYDRSLIVEQKNYEDSPEQRKNGHALLNLMNVLMDKYNVNPDTEKHLPNVLSKEDAKILSKLRDKFYDKIKDCMDQANKQIGSTKSFLSLNDASGALLIIFDQIPGVYTDVIVERIARCFNRSMSDKMAYSNIDFVVFSCHLKDMLVNGRPALNGHMLKQENDKHLEYARDIRRALLDGVGSLSPSSIPVGFPVTHQTHPDIFRP